MADSAALSVLLRLWAFGFFSRAEATISSMLGDGGGLSAGTANPKNSTSSLTCTKVACVLLLLE